MSLPVDITIANPDPSAAPTTLTQLIVILRTLVTAVVTGTYTPYVISSSTPLVADQDKVWHKLDGAGRPLGTFIYYGGRWRRQPSGRVSQITMYSGDPSVDFAGTDGLGTIEGEWDGWALCNGSNSTPNLSDKFIVAAKLDDLAVGHPGSDWKTSVGGTSEISGGVTEITLDSTNTYVPARGAVTVGRQTADGNTADASGPLYGVGTSGALDLLSADAGNLAPDAIPTLPPYYALAFVQYVGYA